MKKFIVSILCVATFFIGLGGLIEGVGAKFKSDERALEILRQARQAVGGEEAIANVRSMSINGRATKTFHFDGTPKTEQGDWELNLQLPNQLSKMLKMRREGGEGGGKILNEEKELFVVREGELKDKVLVSTENGASGDKKKVRFLIKKDGDEKVVTNDDGVNVEAKKIFIDKTRAGAGDFQRNDLFRTTLSLLLTPPQGLDVSYRYAGDGSVDGSACDIIEATVGSTTIKLFLNKTSHLPAMMSYQAPKPFMIRIKKEEAKADGNGDVKIIRDRLPAPAAAPELAEYQVKFSDYRTVGGLQLPHRWSQTIAGNDDETIEVASYELNPANIADKFKAEPNRVFVRSIKPQQQQ